MLALNKRQYQELPFSYHFTLADTGADPISKNYKLDFATLVLVDPNLNNLYPLRHTGGAKKVNDLFKGG